MPHKIVGDSAEIVYIEYIAQCLACRKKAINCDNYNYVR